MSVDEIDSSIKLFIEKNELNQEAFDYLKSIIEEELYKSEN